MKYHHKSCNYDTDIIIILLLKMFLHYVHNENKIDCLDNAYLNLKFSLHHLTI